MIKTKSDNGHTEVQLIGESREILKEFLLIESQILKAFDTQNAADVVLKGMIDVAEDFARSITNTYHNSKEKN